MIESENGVKLQCGSCVHKQVCGHKDKWEDYVEEHIELRKKYSLFDEDPSCQYYMLDEKEIKRGLREKNNPIDEAVNDKEVWTKRVKSNPWKEPGVRYNTTTIDELYDKIEEGVRKDIETSLSATIAYKIEGVIDDFNSKYGDIKIITLNPLTSAALVGRSFDESDTIIFFEGISVVLDENVDINSALLTNWYHTREYKLL